MKRNIAEDAMGEKTMDFLKDKNKKKQLLCCYGVFVLNGMLALSIGSLLPFIRDSKGLNYAFCGLIVSLHSVGNLFSGFVSGALPAFIGRKKSILLFNACFALSCVFIIFGNNNFFIAAAFFLTGVARGATSNFCNAAVNELAPGKASILNGLHAMFAIGAFAFPLLLMALTANNGENWIYACYFLLVMGIISWILYYLFPMEKDELTVGKEEKGAGFGFFKEPLFYLCTATLFFYLCAEQGVIGWMITYFQDTGLLPASLSQVTASVLWVMILAGRLTTAWASTRFKKERLLLIMGGGIVCFFFLLLNSTQTLWIIIGIMGFGFSMAGIYPTTVSFAGFVIQKYKLAWSFMLTTASIGSIVMPSIVGAIAESVGIAAGMNSIIVVIVIDMLSIILLSVYMKKQSRQETIESKSRA